MKVLKIVNWEKFQHYKHRNPPWVRLYRDLLNSRTWILLDDASRVLAVSLILLAADNDNKIPLDLAYIQRRAYLHTKPNVQRLIELNFVEVTDDASNSANGASNLHQHATTETEQIYTDITEQSSKLLAMRYQGEMNGYPRPVTATIQRAIDNEPEIRRAKMARHSSADGYRLQTEPSTGANKRLLESKAE